MSDVLDLVDDEPSRVRQWRYDAALQAGLTIAEAGLFADNDQDVGLLRKLVKAQCPDRLIAEIIT